MSMLEELKQKRFLNLLGPDYDMDLVKKLAIGDKVMAEVNGSLLYGDNPISSEYSWTVIAANEEYIEIYHPNLYKNVILPFSQLEEDELQDSLSPAVFHINGNIFGLKSVYIILQMISQKMDINDIRINALISNFNKQEYIELYNEKNLRGHVLSEWARYFKRSFTEHGWYNRSYKRFALRANIKTEIIWSLVRKEWDKLQELTEKQFCDIGREIELLPTRTMLGSDIQHDWTSIYSRS